MAFQVQFISSKLISNCVYVCASVHMWSPCSFSAGGGGGCWDRISSQCWPPNPTACKDDLEFQFSCFSLPSTGNTGLHYQVLGVKPKGLCMVCKHRTNWVTSLIEKLVWPRNILPFLPKTHTAFSHHWCSFNSLYWQSGPEILARQLPLPHESVPLFMWRWWVPPGLVITQVSTP